MQDGVVVVLDFFFHPSSSSIVPTRRVYTARIGRVRAQSKRTAAADRGYSVDRRYG